MNEPLAEKETFARYFAKYLIARRGYKAGAVPEILPLAKACDYILVKADGLTFSVTVIVDREAHPEKRFSETVANVRLMADNCVKYTGKVNRTRMQPFINIYEIGPHALDGEAIARLTPYAQQGRRRPVVSAWLLDTATQNAWTTRWFAGLGFRQAAEKLLRSPRQDLSAGPPPRAISGASHPPYFTLALIVLLVAIFCVEAGISLDRVGDGLEPSLRTLDAMGGLSHRAIIELGQWWRIFTAPLLHASLTHVGLNCLALFLIGRLLEPLVGWRWMAAIFAVSAIGGSLLSIAINPPTLLGVGASGGIVGLFAAALATISRIPSGPRQMRVLTQAMYGLLPALLPFLNSARSGGTNIDYGAHFGGAIAGVLMGLVLLRLWPGQLERPKWPNLGAAAAAGFFAVAIASTAPITRLYDEQSLLAPNLAAGADLMTSAPQLAHDFPHDPRVRLANALVLLKQNQTAGAEAELRAGLAEKDILRDSLNPAAEAELRSVLAVTLFVEGNKDEARDMARSACPLETTGPTADLLKYYSLCS